MDLLNLIKNRRTIHSYKKQNIPRELLMQAIELATYAPNHKLTYPWIFVEVGPEARAQLAKHSLELKSRLSDEPINENILQAQKQKFAEPSYLLLVGIKRCGDSHREKEDYATLACGLQNMALYFWEKGIGTKWSTGPVTNSHVAYTLAGLSSREHELCGFFWVGVPSEIPKAPLRPPVEKFFRSID